LLLLPTTVALCSKVIKTTTVPPFICEITYGTHSSKSPVMICSADIYRTTTWF